MAVHMSCSTNHDFSSAFIKLSARIVQVRRVGPAEWGERHGIIRTVDHDQLWRMSAFPLPGMG